MPWRETGRGSGDPVPMNVILMSRGIRLPLTVFSANLIDLDPRMVPTCYHGEKMGLGTWKKEEISILTPDGPVTMEEAKERFGKPDFRVDRRRVRYGIWERMAKALNIFQKKPYIDESLCIIMRRLREELPGAGQSR